MCPLNNLPYVNQVSFFPFGNDPLFEPAGTGYMIDFQNGDNRVRRGNVALADDESSNS